MKRIFSVRYLMLFLGLSFFVACKKDEEAPKPVETAEQKLFAAVIGTWETEVVFSRVKAKQPVSLKNQEAIFLYSVVFFPDSTALLVTGDGVFKERFAVKNANTIKISGSEWSIDFTEVEIADNSLTFNTDIDGTTYSFSGDKKADLSIAEAKKALLKSWKLDGADGGLEKWTFLPNGYILEQFDYDGDTWYDLSSWRFHSDIADAIVVDNHGDAFYRIKELTATTLKLDLVYVNDEDEEFIEISRSFTAQ